MADNNLTSSISALITQIKSEIPNANAENLKRLARSVRKLGHSGDNEIDTLINNRANALTATATTDELQTIAEAINQVDDTSNPTGATNANADVHVSDTAPASAVSGDLWWKTDDLNLYIYYEDTDGAQWIQANSTVVAGAVPSDVSDLTDTTGLLGSGGATVYADMAALIAATGMSNGDFALVGATNKLYVYYGAWFLVSNLTNSPPTSITGNAATYQLAQDGTPTVITLASTDPEGFPITWSHSVTTGSLGSTATVSQNNNVFTVTPSSTEADAGSFTLTFTANDGVNQITTTSDFVLQFAPPPAGVLFKTFGPHTWTVPTGVTSVSVVCIGSGGSREDNYSWGEHGNLTNGASWFKSTSDLFAGSGAGNWVGSLKGGGGTSSGTLRTGGGNGGNSPHTTSLNSGGGGAGGYTQNGGNGVLNNGVPPAGGAVGPYGYDPNIHPRDAGEGGDGGNIQDRSGAGGTSYHTAGGWTIGQAGLYGGGCGGVNRNPSNSVGGGGGALAYGNNISVTPGEVINLHVGDCRGANSNGNETYAARGPGCVRIIWGGTSQREFPNTNCKLADSIAGETTV